MKRFDFLLMKILDRPTVVVRLEGDEGGYSRSKETKVGLAGRLAVWLLPAMGFEGRRPCLSAGDTTAYPKVYFTPVPHHRNDSAVSDVL